MDRSKSPWTKHLRLCQLCSALLFLITVASPKGFAQNHSTGRSYVRLQNPLSLKEKTLSGDFNNLLASDSEVLGIGGAFSKQLFDYSVRDDYYWGDRDSRMGTASRQYSPAAEIEARKTMARSLRRYVLVKGIPKLLKSREGTKTLAKTYTNSIETVQTLTSFQVKTKSNWQYGLGINPFNQVAWARASKDEWTFEGTLNLDQKQAALLGRWKRGDWGAHTSYNLNNHNLGPALSHAFNPNLNGGLGLNVPLAAEKVLASAATTVSLAYLF